MLVHSVSCRILVAEFRPILGVPRCFALGGKKERNIAIMEYLSVTETAKKWGVSQVLVRKFYREKRIPRVKCHNGIWMIPEDAKRPNSLGVRQSDPEIPQLATRLIRQKKKNNFHGLYDYVQINLTYSSSRMASNRLTRDQIEMIFKKGKVHKIVEPIKVSDTIEALNHCMCVDFIIDHVMDPLTQRMIQQLHTLLMQGTVDQRKNRVIPGVYRTERTCGRNRQLIPAKEVHTYLKELILEYESSEEIGMTEILDFHVRFERLFPFEDGNGRVGRLIMFKECLRHNVMPFIISDKQRGQYIEGIKVWETDRMVLLQTAAAAQERFEEQIELQRLGEYRLPNREEMEDNENA